MVMPSLVHSVVLEEIEQRSAQSVSPGLGITQMTKPSPQSLALDLLSRSSCSVQVAAVIFDKHGIFSWGWNHLGSSGLGEHAEIHAIKRANKRRLEGASIAVAGRRVRKLWNTVVPSMPCEACGRRLAKVGIREVWIQDRKGKWLCRDSK
jgi:deoxycytidylate deaminase